MYLSEPTPKLSYKHLFHHHLSSPHQRPTRTTLSKTDRSIFNTYTSAITVYEGGAVPQSEMADTSMLSGAEQQPAARFSKLPTELKVAALEFVC
jgi:hypothetical protein